MSISCFLYPEKPIDTSPTVVESLPEHKWIAQSKYDGWRLQVYYDGPSKVRCLTRTGNPFEKSCRTWTADFVEKFQSMSLPAGTVLDAEFIGPRGHLKPSVYIFDMLAWDGQWLSKEPYETRWQRCKELKLPKGDIHLAETVESDFVEFFNRLKDSWDGKSISLCEGIVIKARNGKMQLSRNSSKKSTCQFRLKYRDIRSKRY